MKLDIALCQIMVTDDKEKNLKKAESMIREAAGKGAQLIALPEIWNCPYSNDYFGDFAEEEGGQSYRLLASLAEELEIYIIGGSVPELCGKDIYNTAYCFDRCGKLIGKHRKMHLFDVDVPGGITFKESDVLSPGEKTTVIDTDYGKIGVAICFDVRFHEPFRKMALEGATIMILPAAFNLTTGPAHWEISMRTRALDNQVFFAAVSPARDMNGPYQAWGHSCVVSPWGDVMTEADEKETVVYAQLDLDKVGEVRRQLPILKSRRPELY